MKSLTQDIIGFIDFYLKSFSLVTFFVLIFVSVALAFITALLNWEIFLYYFCFDIMLQWTLFWDILAVAHLRLMQECHHPIMP